MVICYKNTLKKVGDKLKFLDERIIALRNEMRENNRPVQEEAEVTLNESQQELDIYQPFVEIAGEEIQIIDQSILDGKVTLRMPEIFTIMLPELASLKYPSERRPNLIYTDESSTINLAFNMTTHSVTEMEIAEFQENMADVLEQAQPTAEWLDNDSKEIDGKNIGFFEIITPALDGDIYNLMFFASIDGKALIGTFNCMEEDVEEWRPVAQAMMDTLKFVRNDINGGANL